MRAPAAVLAALFLFVSIAPASAQSCEIDETPQRCFARVFESNRLDREEMKQGAEEIMEAEPGQQEASLAASLPGLVSGQTGLATTLTDILTKLGINVDTGALDDDQGTVTTIDLGSGLVADTKSFRLKAIVNDAEVFEPLVMALPEEGRDERVAELGKEINDGDDLSLVFNLIPNNSRYGRDLENNREVLAGLLHELEEQYLAEGQVSPGQWYSLKQRELLKRPIDGGRVFNDNSIATLEDWAKKPENSSLEFSKIPDKEIRSEFMAAVSELAVTSAAGVSSFEKAVEVAGLDEFGQLVSNQPQWVITAVDRNRAELAGPDEVSLEVKWEKGFTNINGLRRYAENNETDCKDNKVNLKCYKAFMKGKKPKANQRLSFALEYRDREDYEIMLGDDFQFELPGAECFMAKFAYGRVLWNNVKGENGRLDLAASFEKVDGDDDMRDDRLLLSSTYTQRLADSLSLVLGLSWASEPEYLTGVDEKLSSRLGLTYRFNKPD